MFKHMWNILRMLVFWEDLSYSMWTVKALTHFKTFCVLESLWHCYIHFLLGWGKQLQLMEICIFIKIIIQIMSV